MELSLKNGKLQNGYGVEVDIEKTHLFPLLKATEISKGIVSPTRYVIVTQAKVGAKTECIQDSALKTWRYLEAYNVQFSERKSSIYRNQPNYSLFCIGDYSFSPFKVAISGLHNTVEFTLIPPFEGKPVFVDDTCYVVGSESRNEVSLLYELYNDDLAIRFLKSIIFSDNKRPVTAEVLNRTEIKKSLKS